MKSRTGFVSNSSSSSFIVPWVFIDHSGRKAIKTEMLTKEEVKKLKKYGFKLTSIQSPFDYDYDVNGEVGDVKYFGKYLGYNVSCNQSEVITFLLKNNIGFSASVHYGHEGWFYRKNSDHLLRTCNIATQFDIYFGNPNYYKEDSEKYLKEIFDDIKEKG